MTILKIILSVFLPLLILSCTDEVSSCFKIANINLAIDNPRMESIFFEITDKETIDKLAGSVIVGEYLEITFEKITFLKNKGIVDSSKSTRVKKSPDGIYLIYRTGRFGGIGDSIKVVNILKQEIIEIRLSDKNVVRLNYCD